MQTQSQTVTVLGFAKAPACFWSDRIRLKIILERKPASSISAGEMVARGPQVRCDNNASNTTVDDGRVHTSARHQQQPGIIYVACREGGLCAPEVIRRTETDAQWEPGNTTLCFREHAMKRADQAGMAMVYSVDASEMRVAEKSRGWRGGRPGTMAVERTSKKR